jgi:hypothetical protein
VDEVRGLTFATVDGGHGESLMTAIDYIILGAGVLMLSAMLVGSKVLRAVVWETLRHPFLPSRIEIHDDQVVITHSQGNAGEDAQSKFHAGAR